MPELHYSASILDGGGSRASVDAYSNPADLTGVEAGFAAWIAALDAVISGRIVAGKIAITPVITGVATAGRSGFADSKVSDIGGIEFTLAGTQKHYSQLIPAFADSLLTGNKTPNLTATAVAAYTTLMLGTAAGYTEPMGLANLASVYGAFEGNHRVKGLKGRSFASAT